MKLVIAVAILMLGGGLAHADRRPARGQLRQLLLDKFDRDQDGRLDRQERERAAKALRKIAKRLAHHDQRMQRMQRADRRERMQRADRREHRQRARMQRRFMKRFDLNRDGDVGPGEMPPSLADELRPLDRNGDGWLRGNELP